MPEHDYACLIQINVNTVDETLGYAAYTVIPAAYADVTMALDRLVYHTTDTVILTQTINNITVSTPVAGASLQTEIRDSTNQIVFSQSTALATLDAGASIDVVLPYTYINNTAGLYRAVSRVMSSTGVELAITEQAFTIRNMIVEVLNTTLALSALEVEQGNPQSCIATLTNGGHFDINNLDLTHRIVNATGNIITSNDYQLSLTQGQGTTLTLNQATDNLALGTYQCLMLANIAGTLTELASASFVVLPPPIKLEGELSVGDRGRVLVLLDQADAGADPYGPDTAPTLAERRAFIEQLLTEACWSFTLTEDPAVFESEFHSGGYHSYVLFGEAGKLTTDTQTALREAVFRGEGLIVAGTHDNRNTQIPRLNAALGLKIAGLFNDALEVAINIGALSSTGDPLTLLTGEQVSRIQLDGAVVQGQYLPETIVNPATCDDSLTCRAAITAYDYGRGRSVFADFDLLANATRNGKTSTAAQLILDALTHSHPALIEETTASVIPIQLTVSNLGVDADVRASVVLPDTITLIDGADASTTTNPAGNQVLNWNLLLQANMQATWQAWIQLPEIVGPLSLNATIEGAVPNTGMYQLQANPVLTLDVLATPTLTDVDDQLANLEANCIGQANRISQARKSLDRANKALPDDPARPLMKA